MPPDYGQGATQMFSQRNNPYCELLSKCIANIVKNRLLQIYFHKDT
jgi:hypothetical protein